MFKEARIAISVGWVLYINWWFFAHWSDRKKSLCERNCLVGLSTEKTIWELQISLFASQDISGVVAKHKTQLDLIPPFAEKNRWHRYLRQKRLTSPQKWHARHVSVSARIALHVKGSSSRCHCHLMKARLEDLMVKRNLIDCHCLGGISLGEMEGPGVLMCFVLFIHFCVMLIIGSFSLCHFVLEVESIVSFKFPQDLASPSDDANNV